MLNLLACSGKMRKAKGGGLSSAIARQKSKVAIKKAATTLNRGRLNLKIKLAYLFFSSLEMRSRFSLMSLEAFVRFCL